ncbi:gp53-like domain-containing protein [Escherichia coli]
MHRIDTKTAKKDKFGAGKNGFTRGNPQTGTPATDLDDDYFDMLQEELCSVVEASGASLEKGRHDQLLTALRALLLSRKNPFGDIKSDGTVQTALENLGLGELALAGATTGAMLVNGYVAIPLIISGVRRPLIIQWGVGQFGGSLGDDAGYLNNFPFAFPSACYVMVASHVGHTPSGAGILSASAITKSGFRGFSSVVTAANPVSGCYVAIGG